MTNFSIAALAARNGATAFGHLNESPLETRDRLRRARKAQAQAERDAAAVADWQGRFWNLRCEAIRVGGAI